MATLKYAFTLSSNFVTQINSTYSWSFFKEPLLNLTACESLVTSIKISIWLHSSTKHFIE